MICISIESLKHDQKESMIQLNGNSKNRLEFEFESLGFQSPNIWGSRETKRDCTAERKNLLFSKFSAFIF